MSKDNLYKGFEVELFTGSFDSHVGVSAAIEKKFSTFHTHLNPFIIFPWQGCIWPINGVRYLNKRWNCHRIHAGSLVLFYFPNVQVCKKLLFHFTGFYFTVISCLFIVQFGLLTLQFIHYFIWYDIIWNIDWIDRVQF